MFKGMGSLRRTAVLVLRVLVLIVVLSAAAVFAAAPVPQSARGPAIPQDKGYLVQEIKDGLFWVTDGAYQVMFLVTGSGVIAVDAPPSIGKNYLKAIAEVTKEPVTHVIYSHTHKDHIGAALLGRSRDGVAHLAG